MRLQVKFSSRTTPRKTVSLTCAIVLSFITMLKLEECFFCRGLNSIKFVLVKFRDSLFALNQFDSLSSSQFKVLIRKSGSVWEINKFVSSLCRRSPRQEQTPGKSPWQSSNPLPFYPTYREYRSLFAAS